MDTCIFCGEAKRLSNEHIFPQWLQKYFGISKETLNITFSSEAPQVKRRLVFDRHLNGRVCTDCNGGWMSQLESKAKPILIDLLELKRRSFSEEDSHTLGLWIFKTVLTLHSASPYPRSIPSHHYHLAYKGIGPSHFMIHVAYLQDSLETPCWIQDQNWQGLQQHFQGDELKDKLTQTYRIMFGFGQFAVRVIYFPLKIGLFSLEDERIQTVHPRRRSVPLEWPPLRSISDLWELNNGIVVSTPLLPINLDQYIDTEDDSDV